MRAKLAALLTGVTLIGAAAIASAHHQIIYTPEMAMTKGGKKDFRLIFIHPFTAGHTMNMGKPEQLFVVSSRGENEPKRTDLMDRLKPITWTSLTNKSSAYEFQYQVRGGDHVFCLVPEPYYEKEEGAYIKQLTKVIVNVGGEPGAWNEPVGLPVEIVPMNKPYDKWTGNVFQGQVLFNGEPVPNAEIEVEFLNHKPILESNSFSEEAEVEAPQSSFVLQTIYADEMGVFTYGIPRAGWWGFAALGLDPDYTYEGKECSRDAVIWIQAKDMK